MTRCAGHRAWRGAVPPTLTILAALAAAALLAVAGAGGARGQELVRPSPATQPAAQQPVPAPRTTYMGRTIAQTMHFSGAPWLTRDAREREEDSRTLLKALGVKEGMVVCDLGAGNGFYTLPLARRVGPRGRVLAVEIQPEMLEMLKRRAERAGITNVERILGTTTDPKLPEGKVDLLLLVDVYHEFSNPEEMLAAIRRSLAPRGRLALVEFRAEDPDVPIKPEHKMSKKQILKELTANGFALASEFDELPWQHLMFFERAEAAAAATTRPAEARPAAGAEGEAR